jgi:hypothetical protein
VLAGQNAGVQCSAFCGQTYNKLLQQVLQMLQLCKVTAAARPCFAQILKPHCQTTPKQRCLLLTEDVVQAVLTMQKLLLLLLLLRPPIHPRPKNTRCPLLKESVQAN